MANEWHKVGSLEMYRKKQEQTDDSGFAVVMGFLVLGLLALVYYVMKSVFVALCALFYYATLPWWYPCERLTEMWDIIMQTGTSYYSWFAIICTFLLMLLVDVLISVFCSYISEKHFDKAYSNKVKQMMPFLCMYLPLASLASVWVFYGALLMFSRWL